jgi:arylformamidase
MSAHAGTHMDAPLHFVENGKSIDQVSPDVFIGECQVADLAALGSSVLDASAARRYAGAKRLLIKTSHSQLHPDGRYDAHAALMSEQAASVLLAGGLVLIGTDRLSVDDSQGNSFSLHHRFLGASCVIVEGLLLCEVREGSFFLSATPLLLTGTEASPVRAFLKRRDSDDAR